MSRFFRSSSRSIGSGKPSNRSSMSVRLHCSLAIFRMADAVLDITGDTFRKHFLDQVCQHSPVLWVKNVEPLTEDRDALIWIETENHERFGRPIIKYPVWPERPTSHMSEPFSLPQIKFASFQLARLLCNPLLSTFSVFDIEARSKPFHDVPVFITKRQLPM